MYAYIVNIVMSIIEYWSIPEEWRTERVKKINIECRPSVHLQGRNTWLVEPPVKKKKKKCYHCKLR